MMTEVGMMKVLYHRCGEPENTIEALEKNMKEINSDGVEIDLISTEAGLVLFHDYNLKRIFQINKSIFEISTRDLTNLKIPTFEEFCHHLKNAKKEFVIKIDFKGGKNFHQSVLEILNIIKRFGIKQKIIFHISRDLGREKIIEILKILKKFKKEFDVNIAIEITVPEGLDYSDSMLEEFDEICIDILTPKDVEKIEKIKEIKKPLDIYIDKMKEEEIHEIVKKLKRYANMINTITVNYKLNYNKIKNLIEKEFLIPVPTR